MVATSFASLTSVRFCNNHSTKELHAFCKTCRKKLCSTCIKEEHMSHDWETITEIVKEKKQILPKTCEEIHANQIPRLKRGLDQFDRKIKRENVSYNEYINALNGSRKSFIDQINRLFDSTIDECTQKYEKAIQLYEEKRDKLKKKVEYLENMIRTLEKDISILHDHDIIDMEQEMRNELDAVHSLGADKYTYTTIFVPGHTDMQKLRDMIGEIHSVLIEEEKAFDRYSNSICSVKSVLGTKIWAMIADDNYAKSLDGTGRELKTMKNPCFDMIASNSGGFVLSDEKKSNISILTDENDTLTTIDTKPLHPTWISKTENDDILVTLKDGGNHFNLTPTRRRVVQRMTLTGKMLHTYEFREDGKTRLFTYPTKTSENKNTDICIVNRLSKRSGEIVVLHSDGRVKFTYRGDGQKPRTFSPYDVECDSTCCILFTEIYNRAIHMLSSDGVYLCKLKQNELLIPFVISTLEDILWCGLSDGGMKVMKYTHSK
ncbi:hypothetical protein FSP39_020193 [Pinctada imbricata]|uniref:B box-type domain-containing protein n=1 Tax=Pinctada imbricata TaxID=66713 RepID=A0AA89C8A0_PINIB|nr:hypothetical protein FSP39_020193 [Pinctada imbricata]